jgi:hypothetical protein
MPWHKYPIPEMKYPIYPIVSCLMATMHVFRRKTRRDALHPDRHLHLVLSHITIGLNITVTARFFASSAATGAGSGALSRRAGHLAKNRISCGFFAFAKNRISRRRNPRRNPGIIFRFTNQKMKKTF